MKSEKKGTYKGIRKEKGHEKEAREGNVREDNAKKENRDKGGEGLAQRGGKGNETT